MSLRLSERFPEKRAFITGAASGLGRQFALHLAREGWTLGLSDIDLQQLQTVVDEANAMGARALPMMLDVADRMAYKDVSALFLQTAGGIDLLINNAGVGDGAAFADYPLQDWDWMIGINQMGVIYGCHFFVSQMEKQGAGHIINISSAAAYSNAPFMAAYNVSKAAVRALSETLYHELKPQGIGVSVVMPTFFPTDIMKQARGPKSYHVFAKKMMERSTISAEEVALTVLQKAGESKKEIVLPFEARRNYFLKRFFPRFFDRQIEKMMAYQRKLEKKLQKQE